MLQRRCRLRLLLFGGWQPGDEAVRRWDSKTRRNRQRVDVKATPAAASRTIRVGDERMAPAITSSSSSSSGQDADCSRTEARRSINAASVSCWSGCSQCTKQLWPRRVCQPPKYYPPVVCVCGCIGRICTASCRMRCSAQRYYWYLYSQQKISGKKRKNIHLFETNLHSEFKKHEKIMPSLATPLGDYKCKKTVVL